jgi:pimeloyl-ACP methyl ester carboxylesterase
VLGVLYAARFPEKVSAYVGTGQIGDWPSSERSTYDFTLAEAERRNNRGALRELRAIGAPPLSTDQMMVQRRWLTRFVGVARRMSLWRFTRISLGGPESSIFDLSNIVRGMLFSIYAMWPEVSRLNLMKAAPALKIPVFFFLGRHDRVVVPEAGVAYLDMLTAPSKKLLWFEESGHEPPVDEPAKFNAAMVELVRPVAVG